VFVVAGNIAPEITLCGCSETKAQVTESVEKVTFHTKLRIIQDVRQKKPVNLTVLAEREVIMESTGRETPIKKRKSRHRLRFLPLIAPFLLATAWAPLSATGPGNANVHTVPVTIEYTGFQNSMHDLYDGMALQSTGLRFEVFEQALTGFLNLKSANLISDKPLLTIIDMEKSSRQKRLWVIDMEKKDVLYYTYVSHGKNSGNEFARQFSNIENSNMSSAGFYITNETYNGKHGLSLKLDGIDEGFNTNARKRCIVMHGAEYASESTINKLGFLGRSEGCPAVPVEQHAAIISALQGKTCLYVHAPIKNYRSDYLNQTTAVNEFRQNPDLI